MLNTLYAVWDSDSDDPGIIGLFETKDEADAQAAYATHKYHLTMTVVEYTAKENDNKPTTITSAGTPEERTVLA